MKVYQITATVIVEDHLGEDKISNLCKENITKAVLEDFRISNCTSHFELKETIKYPDPLSSEEDPDGESYDKWMDKSQEIIDQIEMKNKNTYNDVRNSKQVSIPII